MPIERTHRSILIRITYIHSTSIRRHYGCVRAFRAYVLFSHTVEVTCSTHRICQFNLNPKKTRPRKKRVKIEINQLNKSFFIITNPIYSSVEVEIVSFCAVCHFISVAILKSLNHQDRKFHVILHELVSIFFLLFLN